MNELLRENINKHISLSDKAASGFCDLFESRLIKKKEFILKEGETCRFEGLLN